MSPQVLSHRENQKWSPSPSVEPLLICFDASAEFLKLQIEQVLQTPRRPMTFGGELAGIPQLGPRA